MSNMKARDLLESITGYTQSGQGTTKSSDRPVRLGTIEPFYTAGKPRVLLDGESVIGEKTYAWAAQYRPRAGDRVYLVPVGQSYIIGGKITSSTTSLQMLPITSFSNGWGPYTYDTAYYTPSVTKTLSGVVKLQGLIAGGTTTSSTVLFTLPEPFRPNRIMYFASLANNESVALNINSQGEVCLSSTASSNSYVALDNITFNVDPHAIWTSHTLVNSWFSYGNGFESQYMKDAYGRVWHRGVVRRTSAPAGETSITSPLPSDMRPTKQLHMKNPGSSVRSYLDVTPTGELRFKTYSGSHTWWSMDNVMYPNSTASFTNLGYWNGWTTNGTAQHPAGYWKDPDGLVHLQGLVRSGTMGTTIATLPVGFRPSKRILRATVSADDAGRVDILPDGNIVPSVSSNVWFSLDGIVFVGEQ